MSTVTLSEFSDRVSEMMPIISKEFFKHHTEFHKVKVTIPQFVVMDILNRQGQMRMSDLARFINVTTAAMTGIVERLVRDGYVKRLSDLDDRRIIEVILTSKGHKIADAISGKKKKTVTRMFGMISQKEREEFLKILTHVMEHLKENH